MNPDFPTPQDGGKQEQPIRTKLKPVYAELRDSSVARVYLADAVDGVLAQRDAALVSSVNSIATLQGELAEAQANLEGARKVNARLTQVDFRNADIIDKLQAALDEAKTEIFAKSVHITELRSANAEIPRLEREVNDWKVTVENIGAAHKNGMATLAAERDSAVNSIAGMREALKEIAGQKTLAELENEDRRYGDFESAYDLCVKTARLALTPPQENKA